MKLFLVLAFISCFSLTACSPVQTGSAPVVSAVSQEQRVVQTSDPIVSDKQGSLFERVYTYGETAYYRDVVTDVLYVVVDYYGYRARGTSMSILLNPDTGLPMTFTEYCILLKEKAGLNLYED